MPAPPEKARGLVIEERTLGESDKLLTIFSENGKIKAVAKGARKPTSKLAPASRLFAWASYVYFPGKSFARIKEAELIDSFYGIGDDMDKLLYASYCVDLMNMLFDVGQQSNSALKQSVYCLYYMAHTDTSVLLLTLALQIKLLKLAGLNPDMLTLAKALQSGEKVYFQIEEGTFLDYFRKRKGVFQYRLSHEQGELLLHLYKIPISELKGITLKEGETGDVERLIDCLNHFAEKCLMKTVKSYKVISEMKDMTDFGFDDED